MKLKLESTNDENRMREVDSLLEHLPTMVFVKEAKTLSFVRVNKATEEITGFKREVFLGKNDYDLFPRDQAEAFVAADRAVLAGKEVLEIFEEPIQTPDRGIRYLHTKKIPVYNDAGEAILLLGISEDITELKIAQEERLRLYREETIYKERETAMKRTEFLSEASLVLAASLDYRENLQALGKRLIQDFCDWCTISIVKGPGNFERVVALHRNPAKRKIAEELMSSNPLNPDSGGGVSEVMTTGKARMGAPFTANDLQPETGDEHHRALIQAMGVCSFLIVPIIARNKTLGAMTLVHAEVGEFTLEDRFFAEEIGRRAGLAIENSLLYEAAQKAIEVRDDFLSIASHELKTPLTSLKLHTQMTDLKIKRDPEETLTAANMSKLLEQFNRQIDRIGRLVDDMLDISRLERGKLAIHRESFDLAEVTREVLERFSPQLVKAECELKIESIPGIVGNWDRFRIEQVITNLLTNAVKFSPRSVLEVKIERSGDMALLRVRDHGQGIPKGDQNRIFQQFERAVSASEVSGMGLGLYIAREIVTMHGGQIQLWSEPGQGAEFTVFLPLLPSEILNAGISV